MNRELNIGFRLLVGEEQILVEELLKDPAKLLLYYLSDDWESDSTFQGGYCITIGETRWNGKDHFVFDLFRYTLNWLSGIETLLSTQEQVAEVGFWEESKATARLTGKNELEITDAWVFPDRITSAPVHVNFEDFCKQLLRESKKYFALTILVKQEIHKKGSLVEKKAAQRIIEEMCGEEFNHHCSTLEALLYQRIF